MEIVEIKVDLKTIRMLIGGDEPQFMAKDVAELFGFKYYIAAVDSICKKKNRLREYHANFKNIDERARLIEKSDIYRLATNSKIANSDEIYCNLLKQIDKEGNKDEKSIRALDPSAYFKLISETISVLETCSKVVENLVEYNKFNSKNQGQIMYENNLFYLNVQLIQHSNRLINIRSKIIKYKELPKNNELLYAILGGK